MIPAKEEFPKRVQDPLLGVLCGALEIGAARLMCCAPLELHPLPLRVDQISKFELCQSGFHPASWLPSICLSKSQLWRNRRRTLSLRWRRGPEGTSQDGCGAKRQSGSDLGSRPERSTNSRWVPDSLEGTRLWWVVKGNQQGFRCAVWSSKVLKQTLAIWQN